MKEKNVNLKVALTLSVLSLATIFPPGGRSQESASEYLKLPPSKNAKLAELERSLARKVFKGKTEEQSDAFYDIGKTAFSVGEADRALLYFTQSAEKEESLKRPDRLSLTYQSIAIIYSVLRNRSNALEWYKKALAVAESNKLEENTLTLSDSIGVLLLQDRQFAEAEPYLRKAFSLATSQKRSDYQVMSLTNLATLLRAQGKKDEALKLLNQAMELVAGEETGRDVGNALLNLAHTQHDMGLLAESNKSYEKAALVFRNEFDPLSEASALWALGENCYDVHERAKAKQYFEQAREVIKDEPASDLKAKVYVSLGSALADLGLFDEAHKVHEEALKLAEQTGNIRRKLSALLQLGNDQLLRGYPEPALKFLLESEKLIKENSVEPVQRASYMMAIGRCYKALGQYDPASQYYEEALKIFESANDQKDRALALNSLAVLYLDSSKLDNFNRCYSQAKEIYKTLDEKRDEAVLDYNYAQYLTNSKRFNEALSHYEMAVSNSKLIGDKSLESTALKGIGLVNYFLEKPQQAAKFYEQALTLANESNSVESMWEANLGLGKCYKKLGLLPMADTHLKNAVALVEKERGAMSRDSFKYFNLDNRKSCYFEYVDLLAQQGKAYESLEVAERGRARAFLDMLSSRKQGATQIEQFQAPVLSSSSSPTKESRLLAMASTGERGSRGVSVQGKVDSSLDATAITPINAEPPSIEEIKDLVKRSGAPVVEYFLTHEKIIIWVVNPDGTIHLAPPVMVGEVALAEKVALLTDSITRQAKTPAELTVQGKQRDQALKEMYNLLIKPVEQYLPKDENAIVTIVPHGPMFSVPFVALLGPDNKYLVEKHTLAYVPAIGVMRATQKLAGESTVQKDKLLAFGNPITKAIEFLGTLPYAEQEVKDIAALFGPGDSMIKIGQEANKKAFQDLAPQYSNIHLATHGLIDEERPMQSSLVLAPSGYDDGLLTVQDILRLKDLKARLIVLSACQTGRGKISGDGVVGLSRAFIVAGTPSIMVSQWNVDDLMTQYQMTRFYKSYLGGQGKAKSLRMAQLATIKFMESAVSSSRANPRFWAAFQLIGQTI